MRLPLIVFAVVLAAVVAGCIQPSLPSEAPTPAPAESRYAPGDLLQGDFAGAGFDDPDSIPPGAAIVVIAYQPVPGEYVFTLVQPVPGGWAYVYPSGDFVTRLARDRATFESYRLERIGHVEVPAIHGPLNATTAMSP